MTVTAIAALVAAVVVLGLGALTLSLTRQVRRLDAEVRALTQNRDAGLLGAVLPEEGRDVTPAEADRHRDVVITPTPLGPAEVEPELGVTRVPSVTLSGPLIKVAAFSHGVRRALDEESRMRVAYAFRKELRRQRKVRRKRAAAAAGPPRDVGWRP